MSFKSKAVVLEKKHIKSNFTCGEASLDAYIKSYASQDLKRKMAGVFVLEEAESLQIKGYYTLSSSSIVANDLPNEFVKKYPSYPSLPATLIGRLAVDTKFQGEGLGETLLLDALHKSYEVSQNIRSIAVVVDALNENAVSFYESYGFIKFSAYNKLFISMKTVQALFK